MIVVGIAIAGSLASALSQPTEYTAASQLRYRDPLQDLALLGQGGQIFPDLSPIQRSTIAAEEITSPAVTRNVRRELDTDLTPAEVERMVSTNVDLTTNLVTVSAVSGDPEFASQVSNAYSRESARLALADAKDNLQNAEEFLKDELREANRQKPLPGIRISILEASLQRIQGLESIIDPVRIIEEARVPEDPTSPQVARDAILGGVLGLIVAIILAFVRETLDRRLHNAQEVHQELDMAILGRIGEAAFSYTGLASNGQPPPTESQFEAFRVLRVNLGHLADDKAPRSVLITSPLPQEGKSTVAISLASAAALTGARVLLVECDLRRPSFSRRLGLKRAPGLTDYLQGDATPSEILQVVNLRPPLTVFEIGKPTGSDLAGSMVVITAGVPVYNAPELLQSERFNAFLEKVSKAYDFVVLDGSPLLSVADPLELASDAEAVLLCVRVQQTTRDQVRAAKAALSHLPSRPSGVVVTGLRHGDETYEYYYGY